MNPAPISHSRQTPSVADTSDSRSSAGPLNSFMSGPTPSGLSTLNCFYLTATCNRAPPSSSPTCPTSVLMFIMYVLSSIQGPLSKCATCHCKQQTGYMIPSSPTEPALMCCRIPLDTTPAGQSHSLSSNSSLQSRYKSEPHPTSSPVQTVLPPLQFRPHQPLRGDHMQIYCIPHSPLQLRSLCQELPVRGVLHA